MMYDTEGKGDNEKSDSTTDGNSRPARVLIRSASINKIKTTAVHEIDSLSDKGVASTLNAPYPRLATQDEMKTLPHVTDRIPSAAWVVILAGAAERAAYFGIIAPWQNYLQNPRNLDSVPGALGLGQSTATNIYNAFFVFSFLTPMLFALLADLYIGRYRALMIGMICHLAGCILLVATSLPRALDNGAGTGGFIGAMILIGLGAGAVRATFFPFLGDQYIQQKPMLRLEKTGKQVIVDGERTLQLIYNIYFWFTNIAALSTMATTFLEKEIDFWASYLFCTIAMALSLIILALWSKIFVKVAPQGNNLPQAARILQRAAKSGFKVDHANAAYQSAKHNKSVTWTDDFVDEVKIGLHACRVILSFLFFYLVIDQIFNNLVSQAGSMQLHGIPNDLPMVFSGVGCIIIGPILQALYSLLARRRITFGPIARITAAFVFCAFGMAYATGVQKLIYSSGPCYEHPLDCDPSQGGTLPNEVSIWVQVPVYFILAVAEIFGFVTASEYVYAKAPKDMKTVVTAFTQLTACAGSVLGMALSPVSRDPYLVTMYGCLAGVMGVNALVFWVVFGRHDRKAIPADGDEGVASHVET